MKPESTPQPPMPESSRLKKSHPIEGTMKEARASFYELAKSRVRLLDARDFSKWLRKFGKQMYGAAKHNPALVIVWPRESEKIGTEFEKNITHLEVVVNTEAFKIGDEDYSDIMPFVIEHEIYEGWLRAKKGLGDGSEEKKDGMNAFNAKHKLAVRREIMVAEKAGLSDRLLEWFKKVDPQGSVERQNVLADVRGRLRREVI